MTSELIVLLIAMCPIIELRGSIPIALNVFQLSAAQAFFFSVIGNLIPVIILLKYLKIVSDFASHRSYFLNRFLNWLFERTRKNNYNKFKHWKEFALVVLVAIPLPLTGAWTGALCAFIFGISSKKAFPLIALGVLIAGIIVTLITVGANKII